MVSFAFFDRFFEPARCLLFFGAESSAWGLSVSLSSLLGLKEGRFLTRALHLLMLQSLQLVVE